MILLDQRSAGATVHALELGDNPSMHDFCPGPESLTLGLIDSTYGNGHVVLAPDGLFMSVGGGSFRFDLSTAYCD